MPLGKFIAYSTAGAFIWSMALVQLGVLFGERWDQIRKALEPFDLVVAVIIAGAITLFIWWRIGMPGWPGKRRGEKEAEKPEAQ